MNSVYKYQEIQPFNQYDTYDYTSTSIDVDTEESTTSNQLFFIEGYIKLMYLLFSIFASIIVIAILNNITKDLNVQTEQEEEEEEEDEEEEDEEDEDFNDVESEANVEYTLSVLDEKVKSHDELFSILLKQIEDVQLNHQIQPNIYQAWTGYCTFDNVYFVDIMYVNSKEHTKTENNYWKERNDTNVSTRARDTYILNECINTVGESVKIIPGLYSSFTKERTRYFWDSNVHLKIRCNVMGKDEFDIQSKMSMFKSGSVSKYTWKDILIDMIISKNVTWTKTLVTTS